MGLLGRSAAALATLLLLVVAAPAQDVAGADAAAADDLPDGAEVARRINARDEGESSRRRVRMELHDKGGGVRERDSVFLRRFFGDEKRTAIFFLAPTTVKDTAFLTWDHPEAGREDDQWLYLPALRRVRRISAADRGDYFLGTDLTYEDIKNETKVASADYRWTTAGRDEVEGHPCVVVEAVPVDERIGRELGYSKVRLWVDEEVWMVRRADYWDREGRRLKTSHLSDIRKVDGIWTPHRIEVRHLQSGHRTVFLVSDVDYASAIDEEVFTERGLRRGPP